MGSSSKYWIVLLLLLGIVLTCIFFSNAIIDKVVKKTVAMAINAQNAKEKLLLSVEEVDMDASKGSLFLKGISLVPDKGYYNKFINGETPYGMLTDIHIAEIELTGLDVKTIFWNRRIDSGTVLVKNFRTNVYLKKHTKKFKSAPESSPSGPLDSIHLKGLNSIDLGTVHVDTYQLNVLDADSKDTLSSFSGDFVEFAGIDLEKRQEGGDLFEFRLEKFEVTLKDQRYKQSKSDHEIFLGSLKFKNAERSVHLEDLDYRPIESLERLASQKQYADDLFDIQIKDLTVNGLSIDTYRENHLGSIDNILVEGMELRILKNKQKVENTSKRPLLPHQSLEQLNYPIHIGQVAVKNSRLYYKEIQPKHAKDVLVADLTHLYATVDYITSIKDSLSSGRPLSLTLTSKLFNEAKVDLSITMPYNHRNKSFHYTGAIGPANLETFNPLLFPAAHMAIKSGNLESIHFNVNATDLKAEGELTMHYSDLKMDVPKKSEKVEHVLSFLVNSAIHKRNPKRNGNLRVAQVYYNRPPYKGMGGFITKSVLSGVINTLKPMGKNTRHVKTEKHKRVRKQRKGRKSE